MLQINPDKLIYLRMVQASHDGLVVLKRREAEQAKVKLRQLNRDKFKHLVSTVADMLKQGQPTKFAFEGACRHGIRSSLCLQGWMWRDADAAAASVVSAALNRVGATRPTWQQGQPGYTEEGFAPIQRTRCINCHGKIEESQFANKFCSHNCRSVYHNRIAKQFDLKVSLVERQAIWAAETEHRRKQREMDCEHCGKPFIRLLTKPNQRFCSPGCANEASKINSRRRADKACLQCGTIFRPNRSDAKYCSQSCCGKAISEAMRRPPTTCRVCSKKFRAVIPSRKFCSIECRDAGQRKRPDKPCAYCGTAFRPTFVKGGGESIYCSRTCSGMARRKERRG